MARFSEAVGAWASATERRLSAAYKKAIEKRAMERTHSRAEGGNAPAVTSDVYRSPLAATTGMPTTAEGPFAGTEVPSVIATVRMPDSVWLGYQPKYSSRVTVG